MFWVWDNVLPGTWKVSEFYFIYLFIYFFCCGMYAGYFFYFLAYKTLRTIFGLFSLIFSSHSQLYLSTKGSIFDILTGFLHTFLHDLMQLLQRIENIYHHYSQVLLQLYLLFFSSWKNLYMVNKWINSKLTYSKIKSLLINFICFVVNRNCHVVTIWMHYMLFISACRRQS